MIYIWFYFNNIYLCKKDKFEIIDIHSIFNSKERFFLEFLEKNEIDINYLLLKEKITKRNITIDGLSIVRSIFLNIKENYIKNEKDIIYIGLKPIPLNAISNLLKILKELNFLKNIYIFNLYDFIEFIAKSKLKIDKIDIYDGIGKTIYLYTNKELKNINIIDKIEKLIVKKIEKNLTSKDRIKKILFKYLFHNFISLHENSLFDKKTSKIIAIPTSDNLDFISINITEIILETFNEIRDFNKKNIFSLIGFIPSTIENYNIILKTLRKPKYSLFEDFIKNNLYYFNFVLFLNNRKILEYPRNKLTKNRITLKIEKVNDEKIDIEFAIIDISQEIYSLLKTTIHKENKENIILDIYFKNSLDVEAKIFIGSDKKNIKIKKSDYIIE